MRMVILGLLLLGCSGADEGDEDGAGDDVPPGCFDSSAVRDYCRDAGYSSGFRCERIDASWPEECRVLGVDNVGPTVCCP